jgi:hypothetical protein
MNIYHIKNSKIFFSTKMKSRITILRRKYYSLALFEFHRRSSLRFLRFRSDNMALWSIRKSDDDPCMEIEISKPQ